MRSLLTSLALLAIAAPAFAEVIPTVPEPGTLGLVGLGVAGAIWLIGRKRK